MRKSLRIFGAIVAFLGANVILSIAGISPAAAAYQGSCTPTDDHSGTCVIDEPEDNSPGTDGTATYAIDNDTITFDFELAPGETNVTNMKVCLTVADDNPYEPTDANTCKGNTASLVFNGDYTDPYSYDLTQLDGYDSGDHVAFAVHLTQQGMTTYITGGGTNTTDCQPTTENNQCNTCTGDDVADGQGNCAPPPCEPSTENNQCTPCDSGQTPDGNGGCDTPCEPSTENNQCHPCAQGTEPDGNGKCEDVLGTDTNNPPDDTTGGSTPKPQPAVEGASLPKTGATDATALLMILGGALLAFGAVTKLGALAVEDRVYVPRYVRK